MFKSTCFPSEIWSDRLSPAWVRFASLWWCHQPSKKGGHLQRMLLELQAVSVQLWQYTGNEVDSFTTTSVDSSPSRWLRRHGTQVPLVLRQLTDVLARLVRRRMNFWHAPTCWISTVSLAMSQRRSTSTDNWIRWKLSLQPFEGSVALAGHK